MGECPRNVLLVSREESLQEIALALGTLVTLGLCLTAVVMLVRQWRAAGAPERRSLVPLFASGGATLALVAAYATTQATRCCGCRSRPSRMTPFAFLAGLARADLSGSRGVRGLIAQLADTPERGRPPRRAGAGARRSRRSSSRSGCRSSTATWTPAGCPPTCRRADDARRTVTEIERHGVPVAAIVHDRAQDRATVRAAGDATALMLENQRLDAELRARLVELRASRMRLVEAADTERRRLERNLHDGAQSRLVALAMNLRLARMGADDGSDTAVLLDASIDELRLSLAELRDLARGIHPAVLSERGLEPAVRSLAARAARAGRGGRRADRAAPGRGRDGGLLRGLGGADQRLEVRPRRARDGAGGARRRAAARGDLRRRGRRRERGGRLRAARPLRPRQPR